jgi:AcrR family transcriptional regulator
LSSQPPAHATKRQLQAAATREQLLAAARDVFGERGYQATTVGAITDRANTAHGTFYLYFKNKEDAFCHVMEVVTSELYEAALGDWGDPPQVGIERSLGEFLRIYADHGPLWRALLEGMLQSETVEQLWLRLRWQFIERLAHALAVQQASGRVRSFDPELGAHAMAAMTEWFAFMHLALDGPPTEARPREELARLLADLWVHAIYGGIAVPVTQPGSAAR